LDLIGQVVTSLARFGVVFSVDLFQVVDPLFGALFELMERSRLGGGPFVQQLAHQSRVAADLSRVILTQRLLVTDSNKSFILNSEIYEVGRRDEVMPSIPQNVKD